MMIRPMATLMNVSCTGQPLMAIPVDWLQIIGPI